LSACAKCGKAFGLFADRYNSETVYHKGLHKNLTLNEVYPDNPYGSQNLCVKCYWDVYENAPAQPVRVRPHKCPRCNAILWYKTFEVFKVEKTKKVHVCPICYGSYIIVDEERWLTATYNESWNIELDINAPNGKKYHCTEKTLSLQEYTRLKSSIQLLKLARNTAGPSLLDSIQGVIDPLSSMNWQMINKRNSEVWGRQGLESLTILFNEHPFQVELALNRERLLSSIGSVAVNCLNCGSLIPKAKVGFCPFCSSDKPREVDNSEPMAMLKFRLAKGEITPAQYEELKKIIES
jgi:hypothetical protein